MEYFDFREGREGTATMHASGSGLLPDTAPETSLRGDGTARIGLFADMMPQSIITRVVAYNLSEIWLCGHETQTLINNLYATIVPDIRPEIRIRKCEC